MKLERRSRGLAAPWIALRDLAGDASELHATLASDHAEPNATAVSEFRAKWEEQWRGWGRNRQTWAAHVILEAPAVRKRFATTAMNAVMQSGVVRSPAGWSVASGWAVASVAAAADSGPGRSWWGVLASRIAGPCVVDVVAIPADTPMRETDNEQMDEFQGAVLGWRALTHAQAQRTWQPCDFTRALLQSPVLRGFRRSAARRLARAADARVQSLPAGLRWAEDPERAPPEGLVAMQLEWLGTLELRGYRADAESVASIRAAAGQVEDPVLRAWAIRIAGEGATDEHG